MRSETLEETKAAGIRELKCAFFLVTYKNRSQIKRKKRLLFKSNLKQTSRLFI